MRSDGTGRLGCRVTYLRHGSENAWIGAAEMRPVGDGREGRGVVDVTATGPPGRESSVAVTMILDVAPGSTEEQLLRLAFTAADPVLLGRYPGASIARESEWNRQGLV